MTVVEELLDTKLGELMGPACASVKDMSAEEISAIEETAARIGEHMLEEAMGLKRGHVVAIILGFFGTMRMLVEETQVAELREEVEDYERRLGK